MGSLRYPKSDYPEMTNEKLLTLAIHTYEKALPVKALLEREGIYVELNNVNLETPDVFAGVRVRIPEKDLPLALRLVENFEIFAYPDGEERPGGMVLVPTDFSECSEKAVRLAFTLANSLRGRIRLLYSFIPPGSTADLQLSDSYDYDADIEDIEISHKIEHDSKVLMLRLEERLRLAIKAGEIPAVKFDSIVTEGIPEDAILACEREQKPSLIVMGTRGAGKKQAELIGSVTAEVLDSCRTPAFTVPENVSPDFFRNLKSVGFFCNLDQQDILALDTLYRMFPVDKNNIEVTLLHIPSRRRFAVAYDPAHSIDRLLSYCKNHFPDYRFRIKDISLDIFEKEISELEAARPFDLVCMPNKKRSVFARFFNPSLAHKILFRADIPMMVIPV